MLKTASQTSGKHLGEANQERGQRQTARSAGGMVPTRGCGRRRDRLRSVRCGSRASRLWTAPIVARQSHLGTWARRATAAPWPAFSLRSRRPRRPGRAAPSPAPRSRCSPNSALISLGVLEPSVAPLGVPASAVRILDLQLPSEIADHLGRHGQWVRQEQAQILHRGQLHRETKPVVITAPPGAYRQRRGRTASPSPPGTERPGRRRTRRLPHQSEIRLAWARILRRPHPGRRRSGEPLPPRELWNEKSRYRRSTQRLSGTFRSAATRGPAPHAGQSSRNMGRLLSGGALAM